MTFFITTVPHERRRVNVREQKADGSLVFRSHVGTAFPQLNTAIARIKSLYPEALRIIRLG